MMGTAEGEVLASAEGPKSAVVPGRAQDSADVIAELVTQRSGKSRSQARYFLAFSIVASLERAGRGAPGVTRRSR